MRYNRGPAGGRDTDHNGRSNPKFDNGRNGRIASAVLATPRTSEATARPLAAFSLINGSALGREVAPSWDPSVCSSAERPRALAAEPRTIGKRREAVWARHHASLCPSRIDPQGPCPVALKSLVDFGLLAVLANARITTRRHSEVLRGTQRHTVPSSGVACRLHPEPRLGRMVYEAPVSA
jgi:hypothetical protein